MIYNSAGWRNDYALGSGQPTALLIPGPSGPDLGPATLPGPARRAMPLVGSMTETPIRYCTRCLKVNRCVKILRAKATDGYLIIGHGNGVVRFRRNTRQQQQQQEAGG